MGSVSSLPKGAQRVAARVGVASVHVEPGCAFSGRRYVAYAASGYWFASVECQTVIASTVAELSDYARPSVAPVDAAPVDAAPVDAAPVDAAAVRDAYHVAWLAADTATADLVPFVLVADTVDAAAAECAAARRRVAETRQASPFAYETACRVRDAVADRAYARIVDAVADAADGYEPEAVAVVVVPSVADAAYAMLQRSGVACISPARPDDGAPAGAWFASCGARPSLAFANVADALSYATGHAAPSRRDRRGRRAVLPGEIAPPITPSHGTAAPTLPRLSGRA